MKILHIIYSAEKRADSIGSNQFIQISVFFTKAKYCIIQNIFKLFTAFLITFLFHKNIQM